MSFEGHYYPIIYLRGYAATMGAIEETVATPFMGFNLGATKLREDYDGNPKRHIFESPLIRLMKDHGYVDSYQDGDFPTAGDPVADRSVWVFRYYEIDSEELGSGVRQTLEKYAEELRVFILRIRDHICRSDANKLAAFQVHLVTHSMGGLIARCYLQNICQKGIFFPGTNNADTSRNTLLELGPGGGNPMVDKVFTYGTPHNGIEFRGIGVPRFRLLNPFQTKVFNRNEMRDYLNLPDDKAANDLNGTFQSDRFFCFIGTNFKDYDVGAGLVGRAAGPMSDGLVLCKNAWVKGAARAFAHRAHSGPYGLVNSEEGYQNLRRFLFGDVRADIYLNVDQVSLTEAAAAAQAKKNKPVKARYYIETIGEIRGVVVNLHERLKKHASAIVRKDTAFSGPNAKPMFLTSCFLDSNNAPASQEDGAENAKCMNFAVDVGVTVPEYEIDHIFLRDIHLPGDRILNERVSLYMDVGDADENGTKSLSLKYSKGHVDGLGSGHHIPINQSQETVTDPDGTQRAVYSFEIPVGFAGDPDELPGGKLIGHLIVKAWFI